MLNPDSIMFRAPNEKYREEYEQIFRPACVVDKKTSEEIPCNDLEKRARGCLDCSGYGRAQRN